MSGKRNSWWKGDAGLGGGGKSYSEGERTVLVRREEGRRKASIKEKEKREKRRRSTDESRFVGKG